jgi:hypothetical protein
LPVRPQYRVAPNPHPSLPPASGEGRNNRRTGRSEWPVHERPRQS